ncbi:hypothetical protein B0O80DRAFT_464536 [Mortierella sp. GBAus27b]|nr:hypothetical protein B0O80DRAFT_464536 [Mortierella sp. GBAus27b]
MQKAATKFPAGCSFFCPSSHFRFKLRCLFSCLLDLECSPVLSPRVLPWRSSWQ